ncbi:MAG: MlaD family protein [Candidatus Kapaibacterium sp.]|nr:MCE family protein [Ignavibacteriota bacterium]MCB9221837.1 MCE family protein [Ignavibacteria bacterium]
MNPDKKKELIVGLVALAGIVMLIVGVMLGNSFSLSGHQKTIHFMFPSSGGIKPSSPVVVNGVERGSVTKIENKNDSVFVTALIDGTNDIYTDATARITILEITGGKKLEIFPGNSSQTIPADYIIRGKTAADLGDLIADVGEVSVDLKRIVRGLDTLIVNANGVLGDTVLMSDLRTTITNASEAMERINNMVAVNEVAINSSIANLSELSRELNSAVKEQKPNIERIITDMKQVSEKAVTLIDKVDNSWDDVSKITADVRKIIEDIQSNESLLNKLLYDKKLAQRLDSVMYNLGTFVEKIDQHGINVNVRLGTRP